MPRTEWSDLLLTKMKTIGDPPADAIIQRLVEEKGAEAVHAFFHTLITNIRMPVQDIPEFVRPFLQATSQLPEWADPDLMQTAHDYFVDHGPKWLLLLYFKSLPILYACGDGALVLTRTGRLAHDAESLRVFSRRIAETGQFLLDVMSKDAFDTPGSRGFEAIQKVRLIHASIRQFVQAGGWDTDKHGLPVNQLHMAGTLMTFSIALIDGLQQFGIEESGDRQMAYLHRWQVIGTLLGVSDDGLPADIPSARSLLDAFVAREAHENQPGKHLAAALVDFGKQAIPKERFDAAPQLLIQYLAGNELASMIGVAPAPGCLARVLPGAVLRVFGLVEKLEDRHSLVQTVLDKISVQIMRFMVQYFREEKGVRFRIEGFEPGVFLNER